MLKSSVSGFPEFLPPERAAEQLVLRKIRRTFANYGFENVENRAIEPVPALLAKGETSKEVYVLSRLQDAYESEDGTVNLRERLNSNKQLGLHFDLTVPFARYVVEAAGQLHFPFRRTSIGKVWRGERPQAGRFREFVQADVDIVACGQSGQDALTALPLFHDTDIVKAVASALQSLQELGVPRATIHINNRKLLQGCYEALGVQNFAKTLQTLDKLDKIGAERVLELLTDVGESAQTAQKCIELASISGTLEDLQNNQFLQDLVGQNDLARVGYEELVSLLGTSSVLDFAGVWSDTPARGVGGLALPPDISVGSGGVPLPRSRNFVSRGSLPNPPSAVMSPQNLHSKSESTISDFKNSALIANLKITRGLDYYTGSVFETFLEGHEGYGSIASGGRYDNLASTLPSASSKVHFPGVGMSIGVTRLMAIGFENGFFDELLEKYAPAKVVVAVGSEETRDISNQASDLLRANDVSAYTCPNSAKFGKQIDFAFKRGIPYILFPVLRDTSELLSYRLKNVQIGEEQEFETLEDACRHLR